MSTVPNGGQGLNGGDASVIVFTKSDLPDMVSSTCLSIAACRSSQCIAPRHPRTVSVHSAPKTPDKLQISTRHNSTTILPMDDALATKKIVGAKRTPDIPGK
jgi:hypothetical protein